LRLEPEVIERLKIVANRKGISYQTLIRMWVMERLAQMSEGA
jgi:predicted DNA binding CopG/RHH family protein